MDNAPLEDQNAIAQLAAGVAKRLRGGQPQAQVLDYLISATRWPPERAQTFVSNIAAQESAPKPTYSGGPDPETEAVERSYLFYALGVILLVVVSAIFGLDIF